MTGVQTCALPILKMIQNSGNRMGKIQETFNKDLEELKSKQTMINTTINEIKNSLEGINSRITEVEERISDLEEKIYCRCRKIRTCLCRRQSGFYGKRDSYRDYHWARGQFIPFNH